MEMDNAATSMETEETRPSYQVAIHMYSGKEIRFNADEFAMEREGGAVTKITWKFTPDMLQPGVCRPMLELLDYTRVEFVTVTVLRA